MGWHGPVTHRQFTGWAAWEAMEYDNPSRSDYYLMLVATRVQQVLASKPDKVKLENQVLRFSKKPRAEKDLTPEQAAAMSRARWFGWFGGKGNVRGADAPPPSPQGPGGGSES